MSTNRALYSFINEDDVMKRLNGNMELFNRLFGKFITMYRTVDINLQQLFDQRDYEAGRLLAHTLKGTSANLGVTELWSISAALEKSIVDKDDAKIQSDIDELSKALEAILKEFDEV